MDDEIKSLHTNQTWTTEPVLKGPRAIPVKWVFKLKKDANGIIERFKAKLVANGFTHDSEAPISHSLAMLAENRLSPSALTSGDLSLKLLPQ